MPTNNTQGTAVVGTEEQEMLACSACLNDFPADDGIYFDDQDLCPECAEELTGICSCCGDRIWNENNTGDSSITLCQHCYDNHYTTCEGCGAVIHFNNAYRADDEDNDFCWDCYSHRQSKHKVIHDYSYKPEPEFFPIYNPHDLYLGVELEIDNAGEDSYNAEELLRVANRLDEHLYIKHDGSLNDGMELVSHPCTLEYHMKHLPWQDICKKAVEMGYTSHNAGTAGLHCHVSRSALGGLYLEQDEVIARILYFMEAHFNEMLRFSRRTEAQLNRWAARYGYKERPKDVLEHAKNSNLGRYAAVNLQPYDTIEFRIFRGTLKYSSFIAALQIVETICRAALSMSDDAFRSMSWGDFVLSIDKEKYPDLIQYLKGRRLFVNEAVTTGEEI
jgi:hypothetical protein